jgi:two-component system cell cycle sensor histidine kinase/response regulator CckA
VRPLPVPNRSALRVLLVEDSEADATLIVHALQTEGRLVRFHRVDTAEGFQEALLSAPWDVVVSDHRLPQFDALEALARLHESGLDVPFILVSGTVDEARAIAAMKAGAHDYLMKDNLARLAPAVERECAEAAQRAGRRRADAALRRSEMDLRAVMEHVPDGLLTVSAGGLLVSMNPAAEGIFGVESAEVVGRPADELLPPGFQGYVGQGSRSSEARRRDGTMVHLELAVAEVPGGDQRLVVSVRDVTERKRLEAEVQRTQKMDTVGMLAGGVAHDFNNVLTGIQSAAALARLDLTVDHSAQSDLAEIERQCQRAGALVRQLLAFARRQPLAQRSLSVNQVVLDVESLLRRVIGEPVKLQTELAEELWTISGDPAQLEQVLMNLCVNARDAMPEGGTLVVKTRNVEVDGDFAARHSTVPGKRMVELSVRDTGVGIPAGTLERIFEPFFTTKAPGRGTGLGLAVVHGIVRQHQGAVEVSSAPGRGSTFQIVLPAIEGMPLEAERRRVTPAPRTGGTVLVVEDDAAVRQGLARLLERSGFRALTADDAESALALLAGVAVDLVILDAVLPGLSGIAAYRTIHQRHPSARVLVVSGYGEGQMDPELRRDPGTSFLQKPFTHLELLEAVQRVLGGRATG